MDETTFIMHVATYFANIGTFSMNHLHTSNLIVHHQSQQETCCWLLWKENIAGHWSCFPIDEAFSPTASFLVSCSLNVKICLHETIQHHVERTILVQNNGGTGILARKCAVPRMRSASGTSATLQCWNASGRHVLCELILSTYQTLSYSSQSYRIAMFCFINPKTFYHTVLLILSSHHCYLTPALLH